jgi:hypothetical protein
MNHNNKKMGNVYFTFIYKFDRAGDEDNNTQKLIENYFNIMDSVDKSSTFKEIPELQLIFYNIPNNEINLKLSEDVEFTSLRDIKEVEFSEELKGDNIQLSRLLELLDYSCKKYDFYTIMKKIFTYICKKEFTRDKLQLFKEKLIRIFQRISEMKDIQDKITTTFIFTIFRNLFFPSKRLKEAKSTIKKKSNKNIIKINDEVILFNIRIILNIY